MMVMMRAAAVIWALFSHFILLTVLFSRTKLKTNVEDMLGAARPQTCARAVTALDPQLAK